MQNPSPLRVLLLLNSARKDLWPVAEGVAAHAQSESWEVICHHVEDGRSNIEQLAKAERARAIIACIPNMDTISGALANGIPVVSIVETRSSHDDAEVITDNDSVGRMGADHLNGLGYRRLHYVGATGNAASDERRFAFSTRGRSLGCDVQSHDLSATAITPEDPELHDIVEAVLKAEVPVGIMAATDSLASMVVRALRTAGAQIPERISVLGTGDDHVVCSVCNPSLSSVSLNPYRLGHEAARLLASRLSSPALPPVKSYVEAAGVIARKSTSIASVDNPFVARALAFIQENFRRRITILDVAEHVHCSRSHLERKFRLHISRSPQREIRRLQLEEIKRLLIETDMTHKEIASQVGFDHVEYLNVFFKRFTGLTPGKFRKQQQAGRPRQSRPSSFSHRSGLFQGFNVGSSLARAS